MTKDSWVSKIVEIKTLDGLKEATRVITDELAFCDVALDAAIRQRALYEENESDMVKRAMINADISVLIKDRAELVDILRVIHEHSAFMDCGMKFE